MTDGLIFMLVGRTDNDLVAGLVSVTISGGGRVGGWW